MRGLCEKFAKDQHFEDAVEGMFRIGDVLNGQKTKILELPQTAMSRRGRFSP